MELTGQVLPGPMPGPVQTPEDQATRYLGAAVHLDEAFCERVVQEYLAEPRRALPPAPGVDARAALRDAVAARRRRKIRDWSLLVLSALFVLTNVTLFLLWLLTAMCWRYVHRRTSLFDLATKAFRLPAGRSGIVGLIVVAVLVTTLYQAQQYVGAGLGVDVIWAFVLTVAIATVLGGNRLIEWWLATISFGRSYSPVELWRGESRVRNLGTRRFAAQLAEQARDSRECNVIVFRGSDPFVGAGERVRSWELAIPLEPAGATAGNGAVPATELVPHRLNGHPDGRSGAQFTPMDVYRQVHAEFEKIKTSLSLAPSRRLSSLTVTPVVVAAATMLLDHYDHPMARWLLPDLGRRPVSVLPPAQVTHVADEPVEWLRHFQRIQIESWDRELVVSAFLHVGCDRQMLYLEWSYHVLYPISRRYRLLDQVASSGWPTVGLVLSDLVGLPATLVARARSAASRVRLPRDERPRPGWVTGGTYGARSSIRELAAARGRSIPEIAGSLLSRGIWDLATELAGGTLSAGEQRTRSYFEDSDIERYSEILERHMFGAIAAFLHSRGLSTRELGQRAMNVINNYGGNAFAGSSVTGTSLVVNAGTGVTPPSGSHG